MIDIADQSIDTDVRTTIIRCPAWCTGRTAAQAIAAAEWVEARA